MLAAGAVESAEVAYLWPCNVDAWSVWGDVQTQWRTGMGGPTGLDYAGVCAHLDELGLVGDERSDIYAGLRAAERASLEAWSEKSKQQQQH